MNRISVLISGSDMNYNRTLALALTEADRDLTVSCISEKGLSVEEERLIKEHDIIIIENGMKLNSKQNYTKCIVLCENKTDAEWDLPGNRALFKYQNVKNIASAIREKADTDNAAHRTGNKNKSEKKHSGNMRIIGITGTFDEASGMEAARVLAEALAESGKRILFLDLREHVNHISGCERRGTRNWDDFIYCCIYGSHDDIWTIPEKYSSADVSGFLFFDSDEGKNPFMRLEENEVSLFFVNLKENMNLDYAIAFIPVSGTKNCMDSLENTELLITIDDGSAGSRKGNRRIVRNLTEEGFGGRIISLCYSESREQETQSDFSICVTEGFAKKTYQEKVNSDTWKGIRRLVEFIGEECFE